MSQDGLQPAETLDRRSVLQSVGGVLGLSAGGAFGAQQSIATTVQDSVQPPSIRGSVEQAIITGAVSEAALTLYDADGEAVAQAQADTRGSYVFENVDPADGYRVTQTVDGEQSERSTTVRVLSPENTPAQQFYDQQDLTEGFGYLEVRDGTTLAQQVLLPENQEPPYPTLILHSGYEPSVSIQGGDQLKRIIVDGMGYAIVGVNMRGSACSGGKFDFGEQLQRLDGYDIVETIAAQDWAGNVGMVGLSFPGFTQLYVAAAQPPSLDCIAPGAPIGDFYRDTAYPGGIQNSRFATEWAEDRDRAFEPGGGSGNVDQRIANGDQTCEANQQLRLQNRSLVDQMERSPYYEGLFRERAPLQILDQIEVPTFLVVSWQDEQTGPRAARLYEFLPDDTPVQFAGTNGGHAAYFTPGISNELFRFYEYYLKEEVPDQDQGSYGEALAAYESEPVTMFWERSNAQSLLAQTSRFETTHTEWPPENVETWELYCQPDGTLDDSPPDAGSQETSSYEYSPIPPEEQQITRDDQGRLQWEHRPDDGTVAFVSEELTDDHVCLGSGLVDLSVVSTAADTDVQVTLSEVRPDGEEMFVQMGVLRASHRAENPARTKPRRPWHTHRREDAQPLGEGIEQMRVELFPFGHVFREGSRVRLAIEVPGGNRDRWAFELHDTKSTNEVVHMPETPTKLALPLVPAIDADIPDYPDCGNVWHQPCRPAEFSPVDNSGDETGDANGDGDGDTTDDASADGTDGNSDSDEATVNGAEESSEDDGESADDSGPGFTAGGALAGLGGAGYLLKRQLQRDAPPEDSE